MSSRVKIILTKIMFKPKKFHLVFLIIFGTCLYLFWKPMILRTKTYNIYESPDNYILSPESDEISCKSYLKSVDIINSTITQDCSDIVPIDRSLPDTRPQECKFRNYPEKLPTTSVIIYFHNEHLSLLLRTIYSVFHRSPKNILLEILLMDDASDNYLKEHLDYFLKDYDDQIRIIKNEEKIGFARSINKVAEYCLGEIMVILDSHCEVNVNWLPPLLTPIKYNDHIVTVPKEDLIDFKSLEYQNIINNFRGVFSWNLSIVKSPYIRINKQKTEPYYSPVLASYFAIKTSEFLKIKGFDAKYNLLNSTFLDLSIKLWSCWCKILWVPCSRVGKINIPETHIKSIQDDKDKKRLVDSWFEDDFLDLFYIKYPMLTLLPENPVYLKKIDYKENQNCANFKNYLKRASLGAQFNLNLTLNFRKVKIKRRVIFKLSHNIYFGHLRSVLYNKCLDTDGIQPFYRISLRNCTGLNNNQVFRLNEAGNLIVQEYCVIPSLDNSNIIISAACPIHSVYKVLSNWVYHEGSKLLKLIVYGECLYVTQNGDVRVSNCDNFNKSFEWVFEKNIYYNTV